MEENKKERVLTNFVAPANVWRLIMSLPNAKTQWLAAMAMLAYGYTGVRYNTEDPMAEGVLDVAIPQIDAMNRRDRRGAPRGNQNARKYYKTASDRNKVEKTISKTNTPNCFASNSMNDSELQGVEKTNNETNTPNCFFDAEKTNKNNNKTISKTNTPNCFASNSMNSNELQGVEKTKKTNIEIDIDIESLDNTSPLPELVLSKQEKKEKEKKEIETPLAPRNGGCVSNSFSSSSFSAAEKTDDGKATPAPCNGGASLPHGLNENGGNEGEAIPSKTDENAGKEVAIPQTSSANSHSLQNTPPPTPAPQRAVGSKLTDEENRQLAANIRASYERGRAMADAERDAIAKGEPLPPAAKGIQTIIDDSEETRREREAKRIHDLTQLIEMAETEEEREALRAYL